MNRDVVKNGGHAAGKEKEFLVKMPFAKWEKKRYNQNTTSSIYA